MQSPANNPQLNPEVHSKTLCVGIMGKVCPRFLRGVLISSGCKSWTSHAFVVSRSRCVLLSSYCKKLGKFGDLLYKVSLEVTINVVSVRMNIFLSCSMVTDLFIVYNSLQYDHFRFDSQR